MWYLFPYLAMFNDTPYIKEIRKKDPGIVGIKLWHMYRKNFEGGHRLGRDRFADIVDKYG